MIKLVKNLAMVLVGLGGFVAIGNAISWLVEWLCADNGRFILGMIIMAYVGYQMLKEILGE